MLSEVPENYSQWLSMGKGHAPLAYKGLSGSAITAAIILGVLEIFWTYFFGAFSAPVMLFVLMLLFLFIRPQGIAGKFVKEKV